MSFLTRRGLLQASSSALTLLAGPNWGRCDEPTSGSTPPASAQPFRFVHLTDIHVAPERQAEQGLVQCLQSVLALNPRPDFILTGGDLVMDVFEQDEDRARKLFQLLRKVLDDHAGIPMHHCIGNHDVFGWGSGKVQEGQAGYGKQMVSEYLELPNRYYRFDHKGFEEGYGVIDLGADGSIQHQYLDYGWEVKIS